MPDEPVALISGANRGIGRRSRGSSPPPGHLVLVGSRDRVRRETRGRADRGRGRRASRRSSSTSPTPGSVERVAAELGRTRAPRRARQQRRRLRLARRGRRYRPRGGARRAGDQPLRRLAADPGAAAAAALQPARSDRQRHPAAAASSPKWRGEGGLPGLARRHSTRSPGCLPPTRPARGSSSTRCALAGCRTRHGR